MIQDGQFTFYPILVNVGQLGAIGDGVKDCTTIINTAIGMIPNGGILFFPVGNFVTSGGHQPVSGLVVQGSGNSTASGQGTALILKNNSNQDMWTYTGGTVIFFVQFLNIMLAGNHANNASGSGIHWNNKVNDFHAYNVYCDGFAEYGFRFDSVWGYNLVACTSEHHVLYGLRADAGTDLKIVGGKYISNSSHGVWCGTGAGGLGTLVIIGAYISLNSQFGLILQNCHRAHVIGNTFESNSNGNVGVNDNMELLNDCSNTQIVANSFIGSAITRRGLTIANASCTGAIVELNEFDGHTALNLSDSGTSTQIRHNQGYVTEASGSATINSGSTSVVVTHGLSYTPNAQDINLIATAQSTNDPGQLSVGTITSTQFTITCRNNPGASNLTLGWVVHRT